MSAKSLLLYRFAGAPFDCAFGRGGADVRDAARELFNFGVDMRVNGNLWHRYVAHAIAFDDNAFSRACEMRPMLPDGSLTRLARADFDALFTVFNADFETAWGVDGHIARELSDFRAPTAGASYNAQIADAIEELALYLEACADGDEMMRAAAAFYGRRGLGELGLYKAFRIRQQEGDRFAAQIRPISDLDERKLSNIVGYELQKTKVVANTEAFLEDRPANNVLLYGDGGTGKSSTVKALLNEYYPRGLRIVEIYKHQFGSIGDLIGQIKRRNYKFILYLDDLSFEDFETEYKYFKAIIEGGMESKPANVLIYATSNRRHLIKESFSDKNDMQMLDDVHRSDTLQEKLSLAARFGLQIFYPAPSKAEFLTIVRELARQSGLDLADEELERRALQWDIRGGGKSGRSARQLIDSLLSK